MKALQENEIKLRKYRPDDCTNILKLFYDTVHSVNSADYTDVQLDAWASRAADLPAWDERLSKSHTVVAEKDGIMIGFGSANDTGYVDLLYVHKDFQRDGIATLLADEIETHFIEKGIQAFTTDASITAKPFFENRGYIVQAEQNVECGGQHLTNYKMMKRVCVKRKFGQRGENVLISDSFMKQRIHILGASGSGTTTISGEVCSRINYKHFDSDDYFWLPTEEPFTAKRPIDERVSLLRQDLLNNERWILSGSLVGWGDAFIPLFDLVVFVYVPKEARLERLRKREHERYGEEMLPGGNKHEASQAFLEWAADYDAGTLEGRSLQLHEEWLKGIQCPILRITNESLDESIQAVVAAIGTR